jgi:hypothetical protein
VVEGVAPSLDRVDHQSQRSVAARQLADRYSGAIEPAMPWLQKSRQ